MAKSSKSSTPIFGSPVEPRSLLRQPVTETALVAFKVGVPHWHLASRTELVPAFIDRVPHDYVTGRPIGYQREEAGGAHLTSETWPDIAAHLQPATR